MTKYNKKKRTVLCSTLHVTMQIAILVTGTWVQIMDVYKPVVYALGYNTGDRDAWLPIATEFLKQSCSDYTINIIHPSSHFIP